MNPLIAIAGLLLIGLILLDAFETVVLPRRVQHSFRFTSWFYRSTWRPWRALAEHISSPTRRESFLGYFGPLSLIVLLAMWAFGLVFGFAVLQHGLGSQVQLGNEHVGFKTLLYFSGETFFTLGFGDVTPVLGPARAFAVLEAGMGFAFLGIVIGYLPVIYSRFSERETEISLLDARAGSPPSAAEFLNRLGKCQGQANSGQTLQGQNLLDEVLRDWERWSAQLLEGHLSYPVLVFFRSQHSNQSWLGALTMILDSTALAIAGIGSVADHQARLTFAMARHAVVDLAQVVRAQYDANAPDRLSSADLQILSERLSAMDLPLRQGAEAKLLHAREMYEPYVQALAVRLGVALPPWFHLERKKDNWEAGPWTLAIQARGLGQQPRHTDEHF